MPDESYEFHIAKKTCKGIRELRLMTTLDANRTHCSFLQHPERLARMDVEAIVTALLP